MKKIGIVLALLLCMPVAIKSSDDIETVRENTESHVGLINGEAPSVKSLNRYAIITAFILAIEVGVFWSMFSRINSNPAIPFINTTPYCKKALINRTEAACVSHQPSYSWVLIDKQREEIKKRTHKSCTVGCRLNKSQMRKGVVPVGLGKEREVPSNWLDDLVREAEEEGLKTDFWYTVCDDEKEAPDKQSWIEEMKSYFKKSKIPFWSTKTEHGEGLLFSEEHSDLVVDKKVYNQVVEETVDELLKGQEWKEEYSLDCYGTHLFEKS